MTTHELSQDDRDFRSAFEACTVAPARFDHAAHVRRAYVTDPFGNRLELMEPERRP